MGGLDFGKIRKNFELFAECSSLQGVKYLACREVSLKEKCFWTLVILLAFSTSIYFIAISFFNWMNNPVIISLNPEYKTILDIPLPAITLCNMNEISGKESALILSGNNSKTKTYLTNLCEYRLDGDFKRIPYNYDDFNKFLLNISQKCSDLVIHCLFLSKKMNCSDIFTVSVTDEGVCCTFNEISNIFYEENLKTNEVVKDYWTPEKGFLKSDPPVFKGKPYRARGTGRNYGVRLLLNTNADQSFCAMKNTKGIKAYLHSPHEKPLIKNYGFTLETGMEHSIIIKPEIYEAPKSLMSSSIKQRQCLFEKEHNLTTFTFYSQFNCIVTSMAKLFEKYCNCTYFFLPRSKNVTMCDDNGYDCTKNQINEVIGYGKSSFCLPSCNEVFYDYVTSSSELSSSYLNLKFHLENVTVSNYIVLHFYFHDSRFTTYQKTQLIKFTDFLGNVGGLLGLFLGFSFLTVVEIIYFPISSIYCWYRRRQLCQNNNIFPLVD